MKIASAPMNFHEYRLLKWKPLHRALADVLLSALDRMSEEDLPGFVRNPVDPFSQVSLRSLNNSLKTEPDSVVPTGLLNRINTLSAYSITTVEVMIEMAAGKDSSKLSIPLPILLRATKRSIKECKLASPREMIKVVVLVAVFTHLSFQLFISRCLNRSGPDHTPAIEDAEVVFCIVEQQHLFRPAIEPVSQEPVGSLHPVSGNDLKHIPIMMNTTPPQTA